MSGVNHFAIPVNVMLFQNRYSQELALMYLWQEDYDRARHYTSMAQEFFLQVGTF